ncbi:hypothetical protein FE391_36650 [Nonomuraea sp. KC401]|uniref:hypothetical protein n=1 Tax=unclassified Nonomuraea TaxID=2593643 RepID=UPI0010FD4DF4|nr:MULTISPECIES: hypothetical protein [unclassified Nonomuraea]NBF00599.1 hypothetical protein [Nonomuraea sp. K271]TLF58221.1 hypothetical protein FE391_36650 [Nonomuraea sp. KC401]
MAIHITTLAERPEFIGTVWEMPDSWPKFMDHDPIAWSLFGPVVQPHRDYAVIATEDDVLVGHGHSVPFALNLPGRGPELPDTGWDQILIRCLRGDPRLQAGGNRTPAEQGRGSRFASRRTGVSNKRASPS